MPTISRAAFITALLALGAGGGALVLASKPSSSGGGTGVTSLNFLTGALDITAGSGINVTPSGADIEITNTQTQEWSAGDVSSLGGGLSISGTELIDEWSAGDVTSLATGLSIISNALTPQWQAGNVTTIGSGLSLSGGTLSSTVSGPKTYRATANQTTTSGTATSSTYLTFSASASTVYYIDAWLYLGNSNNIPDFEITISVPSGSTGTWAIMGGDFVSDVSGTYLLGINPSTTFGSVTAIVATSSLVGATSSFQFHLTAVVHVSTTAGTIVVQFAASAGTSTIYTDSMMVVYSGV